MPPKTIGILDYIHYNVMTLNNSKYFAGLSMIMLNLGSRFITIEFSETQKAFFQNKLFRQVLIFSIAWMGTRDIYTGLILTAVFTILADHLLNEDSKLCILPAHMKVFKKTIDINNDGKLSDEEINRAINILKKSKK
jgi:hypothetical protein